MANTNDWWKSGATPVEQPSKTHDDGWWKAGSKEVVPESQAPGLLRSAGDLAIALGSGITQGVKMYTDVAGADNAASRALGKATEAQTDLVSPQRKLQKQARSEIIKAAEESGSTWEEVKAYAGGFAEAPLETTLNALGTSAAPLVAGVLSGGAAVPAIVVRAAQMGLAAAQGVGGVKGQIHESVKQRHLDAGATDAEASKRADEAQAYAGPNAGSIALGGALGAIAGGTGAESAVRRAVGQRLASEAVDKAAPGVLRAAATGAAKEAPMEMLQGGQERHAANKALQGEGFDVPTWQGVAGQAALEGLASAPMGGGFGAMEGVAHKGATQRQGDGAAAFTAGEARKPPESIKSVVGKAQWVRGWDAAQAQAQAASAESNLADAPVDQQGVGTDPNQATTLYADGQGNVGPTPDAVAQRQAFMDGLNIKQEPVLDDATLAAQGVTPAPQLDTGRVDALLGERTPSQRMGLDPSAGALSKAAVLAVDSGASPVAPLDGGEPLAGQVNKAPNEVQYEDLSDEDKDYYDWEMGLKDDPVATQILGDLNDVDIPWDVTSNVSDEDFLRSLGASDQEINDAFQLTHRTQGAPNGAAGAAATQANVTAEPAKGVGDPERQTAGGLSAGQRIGALEQEASRLEGKAQDWATREYKDNNKPLPEYAAKGGPASIGEANEQRRLQTIHEAKQGAAMARAEANDLMEQGNQASALATAEDKAAQIAREGNAGREQQRQRLLDASERWTRMPAAERQALAKGAKGLNAVAKVNVHKKAWADLSEKMRGQLADAINAQNAPVMPENNTPADIESEAIAAQSTVPADEPAKPAAQPVGDEKPFAPETGTLGIPRADMPQVPTANHGGLVKHLNAQGIAHETKTVDAADLKPTQAEFSPSKVEAAKTATGDRAVIVSSDGHIIDGHHQAVAAAEEGKQVKAIVLDAPVEKALVAVKASPSANPPAPATEPAPGPKSVPQRMKEAKAAKEVQTTPGPVGGQRAHVARPGKQDLTQAQELAQGQIENRERQKNEAWAKVKQLRAAVKEGTANRLQLLKAEDAHRQLVREVDGMRATEKGRTAEQIKNASKPTLATDTPAFKRWFGNSKVVEPDGRPMVMYHGTSASEDGQAFSMFDTYASNYGLMGMGGYFTADPEVASSYISKGKGATPTVYPVYLSIKKPLDMDAKADPDAWRKQYPDADNHHDGGGTNESWYRAAEEALSDEGLPKWEGAEVMQSGLRAMGFDGITHIGGGRVKSEGVRHRVFIAFDPEQIKSATGNNGNFDPAKADIRFRRQESEQMAAADFDVASFLQIMSEGQPAGAAAAAPAKSLRPSYSPAARAEAVGAVKGTADAIRKAWANGPEVIVAFDMQDPVVPESARRADLKQRSGGAQGAPEGFYYKGKVYLMASKLKTPGDAARVLFHEALGHHGLRGLFGKDLGLILNQVATMRKADVDAKIAEYGLRRVNKLDRRTAAEEVLAEMAQNTPEIGFVRRAVAAIRTWLRTHAPGFKSLALTDAELIRNFILPARVWVERGGLDGGNKANATFSREAVPELRIATNFTEAREAAKAFQGKALLNAETGLEARVSRNTLDKMLSRKAVEQSTNARDQSMAVANVDRLYEAAMFGWSKEDRDSNSNLKAIHRFFAPIEVDGRMLLAKLTVKETVDPTHGNPLYTVETVEFNEETPAAQWVDASAKADGQDLTSIRSAGALVSLAEGLEQRNATGGDSATDEPMFSRSRFVGLKDSALDQLSKTFTHEGKVSLWDKSVGTMRHLAERAPAFKPVYEAASQNIDDVSMLANDAADMAPRILPRVETLSDLKKKPVSAEDNKAIAKPLFEGTLIWARDENGKATPVDDLQKRYETLSVHNKAAMLLKHGKIDAGLLAAWQSKPLEQFEKSINTRFEGQFLKPGIVWTDAELTSQFSATDNQISLYRESRAAIDRSIDVTARTDMLRVVGEDYAALREVVLAQPSVESAAQLLLDTLQDDAKANPDAADRLGVYMQQIKNRMETAADLQAKGYAPLSRFGRYTVDVVDANGERQYFGMYESQRESNLAKMQLASEFKGATITQGTMSAEAYKLFAGVTPETLEQFGEMLGLKAEGNEAQDKAFQEFLKLTKNNHSAMKRLIHRKGMAGFSEDVGRVVANFVYSNARAGAMGLNAGKMDKAIGAIPKEQGELKDLAMGLRSYIRDPQEEGQAVRGMLFAQYLGGSIASAFVNTTQPFAVTLPWLSQYGGMKKAGAQLARALKDMATKGHQYEADLAKALQSAEDDGVVSPQEIHQLMAQARGAGMLRSGDGTKAGDLRAKLANKWEQGKVLWGQPFALAEQFNRRSTFIAAYRTAREQGIANPGEFARNAVIETQFQYSKANKPRWARGAVGGTLFTFKTYSVSYLELMNRMWTQGGPEGKRAVGWALAMLLLMSGAGGVPFMEDAEDLIDGAGQLMGYNISAKQWRKQAMADVVGKELAEFMEQGISGLPGAPVDVSGRLGMGNLLPGTGLFLTKPNRERDLLEIVGPAGDLVSRGFGAGRKLLGGDVGGAALEVAPTAVRNLAKGVDMAATGMYKDTKGYKVIDTTLAEAAAKAIGFQPKSVAEVQEANSFMLRSKSFYTQTSSEIKAQWADALFRKDEAAVQSVRERLAEWNRDNPEQPIVVKMPDVWKKVREMGKDRSARIADTAPKALREQMREQARTLG